jgi:hypothetical protein
MALAANGTGTTNNRRNMIKQQKLKELIDKIAAHQAAMGLSDEKFVARHSRQLGSVRSWRYRLIDGNPPDQKTADEWEAKWTAKLAGLATEIDGVTMPSNYLKTLPFASAMSKRLVILESQETDRRCLIALAPTGCGKSVWAANAAADKPSERAYVLANESWRENRFVIAARIAAKLGIEAGHSTAEAVDAVKQALLAAPKTVFVDSAQEAGIVLMKLIRCWIDETRARFVYLGYATEYDRMIRSTTGNIDEAKQLLGRSLKPIYDDYRNGIGASDVKVFLAANGIPASQAGAVADEILPTIRGNGNLRLLADALDDAVAEADCEGFSLKVENIKAAVADLCPARKEGA